MSRSCSDWDIPCRIQKAAEDAWEAVVNATNQAAAAADKAVKDVSSSARYAAIDVGRSDVGKAFDVVSAPVNTYVNTSRDIAKGDFKSAGTRIGSAALVQTNPFYQAVNASPTVKNAFQDKKINNLTLQWSGTTVKAADALNEGVQGNNLSNQQLKDIADNQARSAVYGTTLGYAGAKIGAWVVNNPLNAAVAAKYASEGKYNDAIGGVTNTFLPGSGNIVRDVLNGGVQNPSPSRAPSSTGVYGDANPFDGSQTPLVAQASTSNLVLIASALAIPIIILLVKRFK